MFFWKYVNKAFLTISFIFTSCNEIKIVAANFFFYI